MGLAPLGSEGNLMGEEMAYRSRSKLHPSGRRIPSVEFVGLLLGLFLASGAGQRVAGWPAEGAVRNSGTSSDPAPVAASKPPVAIPQSVGWFEIPGTKLQSVCPPASPQYDFGDACQYVIAAWSGGIADEARNRLILWGGGHNDYYGNEIYSLDLNTLKLTRLNNPSSPNSYRNEKCMEALSDGRPNSRHTYGGLAYIKHADRMFVFGGSLACGPGNGANDTWTLDLATLTWRRMDPVTIAGGGRPPNDLLNSSSDYDPNTQLVFLHDRSTLWSYSYDTNTYTRRADYGIGLGANSVIDPKRKLFFTIGSKDPGLGSGPGMFVVSIATGSNYAVQDWSAQVSGCDSFMSSESIGLAYDSSQDRIIGWANDGSGNVVHIFKPETKSCATQTVAGGPTVAPGVRGVFGRFRYFPALNLFALVSDAEQNAFTLKLKSGGGTLPPPLPPPPPPPRCVKKFSLFGKSYSELQGESFSLTTNPY